MMDLQGLIQSLRAANTLKLSLKQKPCTKDSKFYETLEVQTACFFAFITFWSACLQGFQKNNSAYLAGWQQCSLSQSFCVIDGGSRRYDDEERVPSFCL